MRETETTQSPVMRCVLHNIGHHDLYVEVYAVGDDDEGAPTCRLGWCRPLSGSIAALGERLIDHLKMSESRYMGHNALQLMKPLSLEAGDLKFELNERSSDGFISREIFELLRGPLELRSVYAPLIHEITLSHEPMESDKSARSRQQEIRPKSLEEIKRLSLILVTAGHGKSSPRAIAQVIKLIIERRWREHPELQSAPYEVSCEHVNTNPHSIAPSELLDLETRVLNEATCVAEEHDKDWRDLFQLYLSVSTGTTLMISAITLTFAEWSPVMQTIDKARRLLSCTPSSPSRVYKPKERPLASIKEWVAVDESKLNHITTLAVQELRSWRSSYVEQRPSRPKELQAYDSEAVFFHRKGLKEVLCVVVIEDRLGVEGERGALIPIRGVNLEVSLPTGTLCAERNAISTALCRFPRLERRDIKAVAVLSLDPSPKLAKLGPCGACQEWLRKVHEVSPGLRIISFGGPSAEEVFIKPALHI